MPAGGDTSGWLRIWQGDFDGTGARKPRLGFVPTCSPGPDLTVESSLFCPPVYSVNDHTDSPNNRNPTMIRNTAMPESTREIVFDR